MPARPRSMEDEAAVLEEIGRRLRSLEDAARNRLLPPGYSLNIVDGDLVIQRADGATSTLVFA